jgi:hypothetical protein
MPEFLGHFWIKFQIAKSELFNIFLSIIIFYSLILINLLITLVKNLKFRI